MAPFCGPLIFLAAILVFSDASKTFGKPEAGTTLLLELSSRLRSQRGEEIRFNEDHKLNLVIDQVHLEYREACADSTVEGGTTMDYLHVVMMPTASNCNTAFTITIEGRMLAGKVEDVNHNHFSVKEVAKTS